MVETTADLIARQKRERAAMRAQISKRKNELVAIPEPVIIQNTVAVKGFKVLTDDRLMVMGDDNGDVKVADRIRFNIYTQIRFAEASVLKIDQVLEAVLIQYKDDVGSIFLCKPPSQANRYMLETVIQIKTMSASFTTFAADTVVSSTANNHILLVTSCPDFPHKPKMHLLSERCDAVIE